MGDEVGGAGRGGEGVTGSPERARSTAQLEAKFHDCAAHAARPLSAEVVARAIHLLHRLDAAPAALELIPLRR